MNFVCSKSTTSGASSNSSTNMSIASSTWSLQTTYIIQSILSLPLPRRALNRLSLICSTILRPKKEPHRSLITKQSAPPRHSLPLYPLSLTAPINLPSYRSPTLHPVAQLSPARPPPSAPAPVHRHDVPSPPPTTRNSPPYKQSPAPSTCAPMRYQTATNPFFG